MNWTSTLTQIFGMIFTPAAAVYIIRRLFDKTLEKDLERHKRGLQFDLKRYKNELQLRQIEYQTRYALLHQRRAEVIGEFHALLVAAIRAVENLVAVLRVDYGGLKGKKQSAADKFSTMSEYFFELQLYFDPGLCVQIE